MYVLDNERQISLIDEMTQLRRNPQTWEVYYHHPTTNVMWKSYFPKASKTSRGPKILRKEPVPEHLEKRLEDCLVEEEPENAIGLGIELSTEPKKWPQLIDIIEQNYRQYHRDQLPLFLKALKIEDYDSLFEEINYDLNKSELSKQKLDELARRSKKVRYKRFVFP